MTASVSSDTICVLVVGKTGVGKTLFLQRLFRSTARYAKKAPMACGHTVGFNVEVVAVDCGGRFEPVNPVVNENPYVAFVEIGGNRHFVSDGQFPLSLMTFQGVIFLYDRYNVDSAMDLVYWYEHLRGYGIVGAEGGAKVMLIETTHIPAAGDASSMARMVPDELVGAYLQENAKKPTTLLRNIFLSARSMGMWFVRTTRFSVADFQVQQQSFASRFAVALYYVLATIGNLVLYVMAITLFGPGQRSVSFYYPSVTKALKTIEDDISGTLTLKECPLYDQQLFEAAALDSVLRFVQSLR
uniref:Uncharacterized protein TCIL3000_10_8230 n=1 Tax=Trypanosoma congolense (strain IL3000) TaxID=1068625 RepID=G0UXD0_TRYCI|nr:unnamed protein product [Trypanosoma congolense IL3000]